MTKVRKYDILYFFKIGTKVTFINTYNRYGVSKLTRMLEMAGKSDKPITLPSIDTTHSIASLPLSTKQQRKQRLKVTK